MKGKSSYLKWGLTIFLTVCAILVFYDTFYMNGTLQRMVSKLASILSPVLVGLVMAYLLAPIVNWIERLIRSGLGRIKGLEGKTIPHAAGWLRAVSILLTWAIVLLLLYLMFSVVIPQLVDSVVMLINNAETYYDKIYTWIVNLLDKNPTVEDWVNENLDTYYKNLLDILTNKILPGAQQMLTTITGGLISGIWGLVSFAMDFLVGIIVSVYMLAMKEQSLARCCKLLYGVCKEDHAAGLSHHRHFVSHWLHSAENALCPPGQSHRGRHQRDPLLRPLYGRGAQRLPDPAGQPQKVPVFRDFRYRPPAV